MTDSEFLRWLRGRLVNVYKESENVDFVQRLDRIIDRKFPESAKKRGISLFDRLVTCCKQRS